VRVGFFAAEGERARFRRAFSLEKIRALFCHTWLFLQGFFKDAGVSCGVFVVTFVVECVADVGKNTSFVGR
jgi:hypothetical protein